MRRTPRGKNLPSLTPQIARCEHDAQKSEHEAEKQDTGVTVNSAEFWRDTLQTATK